MAVVYTATPICNVNFIQLLHTLVTPSITQLDLHSYK